MWCVGREIGVIALDTERRGEVYFLRLVDYVQTPLCGTTQNLGPEELELCIEEMLKDIKYFEEGEHEVCLESRMTIFSFLSPIVIFTVGRKRIGSIKCIGRTYVSLQYATEAA